MTVTIRRDYLGRASLAASALFLPNFRVVIVLLVLAATYPPEVRAAVGLGGSMTAVVTVLASGFVVTTVRACTPALRKSTVGPRGAATALHREFTAAFGAAGLLLVVGAVVGIACALWTDTDIGGFFAVYWLCAVPAVALTPIGFVLNGAFQSLHRDVGNLGAAATGTAVQALVAVVVVLAHTPPVVAVAALGGATSVAGVVGAAIRGRQLATIGLLSARTVRSAARSAIGRPTAALRSLIERGAASVDGLVFMVTFTVAVLVASAYSPASGAAVALAVSLMRSTIVPLKQFGVVGARFVLKEQGQPNAMRLATVQTSCVALLLGAAAILVGARAVVPPLDELSWVLVAMMVTQLVLEPWGGVLYAYRKVAESTFRGLPALFGAYCGIAAPGLLLIAILHVATAEATWAVLLLARIAFVVAQAVRGPINRVNHAGAQRAASRATG